MDGIHVVTGDLESLSARVDEVADAVAGLDLRSPLTGARSSMPGAAARATMEATGDTLEDRAAGLVQQLREHSGAVSASAASFSRTESSVESGMRAARSSSSLPSPTTLGPSTQLSQRME